MEEEEEQGMTRRRGQEKDEGNEVRNVEKKRGR